MSNLHISDYTRPETILDHYAPDLDEDVRKKLSAAFEVLIVEKCREADTVIFNENLKNHSGFKANSHFVPTAIKEDIYMIASVFPAKEKAKLMRLSYEDILSLKKDFENGIYGELIEMLKSKWVDIYYSEPFDLDTCLSFLEYPYTSAKFIQLLKQKKMPKARVEGVIRFLRDEYKIDDADQEAAAE